MRSLTTRGKEHSFFHLELAEETRIPPACTPRFIFLPYIPLTANTGLGQNLIFPNRDCNMMLLSLERFRRKPGFNFKGVGREIYVNLNYKFFKRYSCIKKRAAADTGDSVFSSKWHRWRASPLYGVQAFLSPGRPPSLWCKHPQGGGLSSYLTLQRKALKSLSVPAQ